MPDKNNKVLGTEFTDLASPSVAAKVPNPNQLPIDFNNSIVNDIVGSLNNIAKQNLAKTIQEETLAGKVAAAANENLDEGASRFKQEGFRLQKSEIAAKKLFGEGLDKVDAEAKKISREAYGIVLQDDLKKTLEKIDDPKLKQYITLQFAKYSPELARYHAKQRDKYVIQENEKATKGEIATSGKLANRAFENGLLSDEKWLEFAAEDIKLTHTRNQTIPEEQKNRIYRDEIVSALESDQGGLYEAYVKSGVELGKNNQAAIRQAFDRFQLREGRKLTVEMGTEITDIQIKAETASFRNVEELKDAYVSFDKKWKGKRPVPENEFEKLRLSYLRALERKRAGQEDINASVSLYLQGRYGEIAGTKTSKHTQTVIDTSEVILEQRAAFSLGAENWLKIKQGAPQESFPDKGTYDKSKVAFETFVIDKFGLNGDNQTINKRLQVKLSSQLGNIQSSLQGDKFDPNMVQSLNEWMVFARRDQNWANRYITNDTALSRATYLKDQIDNNGQVLSTALGSLLLKEKLVPDSNVKFQANNESLLNIKDIVADDSSINIEDDHPQFENVSQWVANDVKRLLDGGMIVGGDFDNAAKTAIQNFNKNFEMINGNLALMDKGRPFRSYLGFSSKTDPDDINENVEKYLFTFVQDDWERLAKANNESFNVKFKDEDGELPEIPFRIKVIKDGVALVETQTNESEDGEWDLAIPISLTHMGKWIRDNRRNEGILQGQEERKFLKEMSERNRSSNFWKNSNL